MWNRLKNFLSKPIKQDGSSDDESATSTPSPVSPTNPSASTQARSLAQMRRRGNRPMSQVSPVILASQTDPNDSFNQLNSLNEELFTLDVTSYVNLRSLLETKFGRGAHLNVAEMTELKKVCAEVSKEYKDFCSVLHECVMRKLAHSTVETRPLDAYSGFPSTRAAFIGESPPLDFSSPDSASPEGLKKSDSGGIQEVISPNTDSAYSSEGGPDSLKDPSVSTTVNEITSNFAPSTDTLTDDNLPPVPDDSSTESSVYSFEHESSELASVPADSTDSANAFASAVETTLNQEDQSQQVGNTSTDPLTELSPSTPLIVSPIAAQELSLEIIPATNDLPVNPQLLSISVFTAENGQLADNSFDASPISPVIVPVELSEEAKEKEKVWMTEKLEKALFSFKAITAGIDEVRKIVENHKSQVNPQAVISANSEIGNLQKYFVRTKYKEMVKGCGNGRTTYGIAWAGWMKPGDAWMNDLVKCYWRELKQGKFEWTMLSRKPVPPGDEHEAIDPMFLIGQEDESDLELRRKVDLLSMKNTNPNVLDAVDVADLIVWVKFVHRHPEIHSVNTIEIVETAVENMGGWKFCHVYLQTWIRQFYMEPGRSNIPYPLPGCRSWVHSSDTNIDASCSSLPSSISLSNLYEESSRSADQSANGKETFLEILAKLLESPSSQDNRYWNYVLRSICRDLLAVYNMLDHEFDSSSQKVQEWMDHVKESDILTTGKYKDYGINEDFPFDDSFTQTQKKMLHPQLIKIREKGISIGAVCEPDRYEKFMKFDKEIRQLFGQKIAKQPSFMRISLSFIRATTASPGGKGHKKAASTGPMEMSCKLFTKMPPEQQPKSKKRPTSGGPLKIKIPFSLDEDQATPISAKSVDSDTTLPRVGKSRTLSAPTTPSDGYNESVLIFSEIRDMCIEIANKPELLPISLIKEAYEMSQVIIKHYLTEELPAKYQAVY